MKAVFDESSPAWVNNPEYNIMFLRRQQDYVNDALKRRGWVTIMDVFDVLGLSFDINDLLSIPLRDQCWLYEDRDYIDFGMKPNVEKNVIYLDFNINID